MGFSARLVTGALATGSLNINGATAGTVTAGPTMVMQNVASGTLSATVMMEAETNTITMTPQWQVSNDASTWLNVFSFSNTAYTAYGTGTAGDDAALTRVLSAPDAVYGFRYARVGILNGVATGASADAYSIAYNYASPALT